MKSIILITQMLLLLIHCSCISNDKISIEVPKVKPGIDVLIRDKVELISGKRVGLITNPTGITSNLRSTIDVLYKLPETELVALFGPEHGVRGDIEGGQKISHYKDKKTGVQVYSLYGKVRKPTKDMLKNIDILIYDIQDIGSRAYTYIYSMALSMQAAKEAGISFFVLDRPNPLGGNLIEGNVLDPEFSSYIGLYPIPYIYGMTVGELAQLFNTEFHINCELTIIPMQNWNRNMTFEDTKLMWIPTSPHVPHAETSYFVAATGCIGELRKVSEGVGYTSPFELIGAPWIDCDKFAAQLNAQNLPAVYFRPTYFRPYYMRFAKEQCQGVQIHIIDKNKFLPAATQIHILTTIYNLYPEQKIFQTKRISSFEKAYGTDRIRLDVQNNIPAEKIIASWQDELNKFMELRKKYLIYD